MQEINDNSFGKAVAAGICIVDIYSIGCGPCKVLERTLSALKLPGVRIYKVNAAENEVICEKFQVSSVPRLLFFKDGVLKKSMVGAISGTQITEIVNNL